MYHGSSVVSYEDQAGEKRILKFGGEGAMRGKPGMALFLSDGGTYGKMG